MIERLRGALGDLGQDPTAEELADALWLAARQPVTTPPDGLGTGRPAAQPGSAPEPGLVAPFRSADVVKAFQPLRGAGPRPRRSRDEEMLHDFVSSGVVLPRPKPAHRIDLTLVVDAGPSMELWQATIRRFRELMARVDIFDHVRTWLLEDQGPRSSAAVMVRAEGGAAGRRADEIVSASRRQIVFVVSDCVGSLWQRGTMDRLLRRWSRKQPVAVLQMLPQRMWRQSALAPVPVQWQCGSPPGAANTLLTCRLRGGGGRPDGAVIPVLELSPRWLNSWATVVSGTGAGWVNGLGHIVGPDRSLREPARHFPDRAVEPADRIRRFLATASPEAAELAPYLAVVPLTIPIMGLVQRVMAPHTLPSHLAEVFLGGLLCRVGDDGDERYDFHDGVRALLLTRLTRAEAVRTLAVVSDWVETRYAPGVSAVTREVRQRVHVPAATPRALAAAPEEPTSPEVTRPADASGSRAGPDLVEAPPLAPESVTGRPPVTSPKPQIWGAVPSLNRRFTGREELLAQLRAKLAAGGAARLTCSLHGMGGVGKTQLAVEYAHRHASEYDLVWWIAAQQLSAIRVSLIELSVQLGLPGPLETGEPWTRALAALHRGEPYARWLVIFDNADRPEDIQDYLPQGPGHLIVTSRNPAWSLGEDAVDVGVMSPEESVRLLHRHLPPARRLSDADAGRLAQAAGGLPLALVQAAEFRASTGMPVDKHLLRFEDVHVQPALRTEAPSPGVPVPVYRTWKMAIDRLRTEHPDAVQLLELCCFFAPEPVPLSMLSTPESAGLPKWLAATLCEEATFYLALQELSRFALAQLDSEQDTVQVHRLVQAVVRSKLSASDLRHMHLEHAVHSLLLRHAPPDPWERGNWGRFKEIQPHLLPSGALDCHEAEVRRLVIPQAQYLDASGDRAGARELRRIALLKWRAVHGCEDPDVRALEQAQRNGGTA
ncbi:FxSxx-COOH system tetratricopeptide repeat protein [Streptomyces sp. NBC_00647]|uniref:FxSxx-COOH system tetratricopeptide repeat protein n=1 Tax=Streptomyces sp. NBC_00647 TaxID=2975796 RepID=UPI00324DA29A